MTTVEDPMEHRTHVNGIELAYFEWGRGVRNRDATLLLAYATGLHARCRARVVRRIETRGGSATRC